MNIVGLQVIFELTDIVAGDGMNGAANFYKLSCSHQCVLNSYPGYTIVYPESMQKTLILEIPATNASTIIIGGSVDFNGWTFIVKNNNVDNFFLFKKESTFLDCTPKVSALDIDSGCFTHVFPSGNIMLYIEDSHTWTNRYNLPTNKQYRRDILILKDGIAQNRPVFPYDTPSTYFFVKYRTIEDISFDFGNINFKRNNSSTKITNLIHIVGQYKFRLHNIDIDFFCEDVHAIIEGDRCIFVENCANITFEDIVIHDTFSGKLINENDVTYVYGYGIEMNNVWNSRFVRVTASGTWGVFGCNNINKAYLDNCTLNRFDIHCYGADVTCVSCTFKAHKYGEAGYDVETSQRYNRFTSFRGILYYRQCIFYDFCPLNIDVSYNIYTGFQLIFSGCEFHAGPKVRYLVHINKMDNVAPLRMEVAEKCLPNIFLTSCTFFPYNGQDFTVFHFNENVLYTNIGYINLITIQNTSCTVSIHESDRSLTYKYSISRNIAAEINYII